MLREVNKITSAKKNLNQFCIDSDAINETK